MTALASLNGGKVPLVRILDVWKKRGANIVLKGVNLEADHGTVTCLLGPSGAGKSTLLRCINAIETADRGMIYVDGVAIGCRQEGERFIRLSEAEVSRQRADIGMVFQNFNLFPAHVRAERTSSTHRCSVRGESRTAAEPTGRRTALCASASPTRPGPIPGTCPAASSSASQSRGRWPCSPN